MAVPNRIALAAGAFAVAACATDPLAVQRPDAPAARGVVAADAAHTPGVSYFGANDDIEYIAGDLPLIFSAPHGGALEPAGIPARAEGAACGTEDITTVTDSNTEELVRTVSLAFFRRTGKYPHVVINRLDRSRLDANRDVVAGACGNPRAEQAWHDWHAFIDHAKADAVATAGRGWYTDVHGHGHAVQRLELGYQLSGAQLRLPDATLDAGATYETLASFRTFSQQSPLSFSQLLRGPTALGTLFASAGYPSVPSQQDPAPLFGQSYFNGGYNTDRHGCRDGGPVCGLQIEAHFGGVRDNVRNRQRFASAIVATYAAFLAPLGIGVPVPAAPTAGQPLVVDHDNTFNDWNRARFNGGTSWGTSNGNGGSYLNGDFSLGSVSAASADDATWEFLAPVAGTYKVEAWWPAQSGRTSGAQYRLFEAGNATPLASWKPSQRTNGSAWNAFGGGAGTFRVDAAGWGRVTLSRSASTNDGSLAADAVRVTLVTGDQSIAFTTAAPNPGVVGNAYAPAAAATSGLAVSIAASPAGVCTASGGVVSFVGAGACTITAAQPGGAGWAAATPATQTVTVVAPPPMDIPARQISLTATSAVTVNLLSSAAFDVTAFDVARMRLKVVGGSAAGAPVSQRAGVWARAVRDVNADGTMDVVLTFLRADLVAAGLSAATPSLVLEALSPAAGVLRTADATPPEIVP